MLSSLLRQLVYYPVRSGMTQLETLAERAGLEPWSHSFAGPMGWRRPDGIMGLRPPRCLLVFHGNAGYALDRTYFVEGFEALETPRSWDVYLFEYPGYGARPGTPSEKEFKRAAELGARALLSDGRLLYLLGESLGSGLAAYLAGLLGNDVAGIVMVTPFTSLVDVARHHYPFLPMDLLLSEKYNSDEALRFYSGPAAFIIAEKDEIVPARLGKTLYDHYRGPKRLWIQQGKSHNTLDYHPRASWWREVSDFITSSRP
ncbi:MAG: alpha/beta fold hydrolase [Desulfobacteraceae bacterium]|jgi:pimeloyl-ACP methyl ester carboxylesterase|nr:MAG: alpha/beta fold hydrolase [Desulfobacteraceae bacterium]